MTAKNTILVVLVILLHTNILAQNTTLVPNNSIEIGYGLLTFRELENILLYENPQSMGLLYGKYMYQLDAKFAIGILGAYEWNKLTVFKAGVLYFSNL